MYVLSKKQMQLADSFTQDSLGLSSEILMENMGLEVSRFIRKLIKKSDKIAVFCGSGNNGGDGIVVARRLKQLGFNVRLIFVDSVEKFSKTTAFHFEVYCNCGFTYEQYNLCNDSVFSETDLIVDAIFGVGFHGEADEKKAEIFKKINSSPAKVVAIDVPSGVSADFGEFKIAVKADYTVVAAYFKLSAFLFPAKLNYGQIVVADVDIELSRPFNCFARTWGLNEFSETFVFKKNSENKWTSGSALIIGGCKNMAGALILAAKSCLKSGIGLLKLAFPDVLKQIVALSVLEATYVDCKQTDGVLTYVDFKDGRFNVIACGPGLSRNNLTRDVVKRVILSNQAVVLDADGLFFLDEELLNLIKRRNQPTILTPHVKEMARLCGCSSGFVDKNRFEIARKKAVEWKCFVVLKGPHTIVSTPTGEQFINLSGNEGLATGGTGDVLTGMVSAFVARCANLNSKDSVVNAVCNAVFLHGYCADFLVKSGKSTQSINATDIVNCINDVFFDLKRGKINC